MRSLTLLVTGMALLAGCAPSEMRLNGAGLTFVFPMMSKWTSEYQKSKHVQINYQSIGSGGGIQQMTAKKPWTSAAPIVQ
jgi:phosphate transport system substrate-binding protein